VPVITQCSRLMEAHVQSVVLCQQSNAKRINTLLLSHKGLSYPSSVPSFRPVPPSGIQSDDSYKFDMNLPHWK
jgi:hypothetical protein